MLKRMQNMREQKGFTLIELAIVLVIIGIIIGAVLKGQDLIVNARAKKFINWTRSWEGAQWTILDRRGVFAGDSDADGAINNETPPISAINTIANANFQNPPSETLTVGAFTFYMKFGSDSTTNDKNVLAICPADNCGTAIDSKELVYFEALDTALDGAANVGGGNVRGFLTGDVTLEGACEDVNGSPATDECISAVAEETTGGDWSISHYGLVYYFDTPL